MLSNLIHKHKILKSFKNLSFNQSLTHYVINNIIEYNIPRINGIKSLTCAELSDLLPKLSVVGTPPSCRIVHLWCVTESKGLFRCKGNCSRIH